MDLLDQMISEMDNTMKKVTKTDSGELMTSLLKFLEHLLQHRFDAASKKKVDTKSNRLNFACPYCGDSSKDTGKKRGNVYLSSMWYKCYNAPCVTKPMIAVINDHNGSDFFTAEQLSYLSNYSSINISINGNVSSGMAGRDHGIDEYIELQEYGINRQELVNKMGLLEIHQSNKATEYASMRKLLNNTYTNMNHLAYSYDDEALVIMNLDSTRTKVMGLQKRFIPKRKIRFRSYTWEQLLGDFWLVDPETIQDDIRFKMHKVTLLYNFFVTKFNLPVLILESGIDANHIPNSIGLLSASTNINLKRNGYYMYDNGMIDKTGNKVSMNKMEDGYNVFLWRRFVRDYPVFRRCKDLNDVFKAKPDNLNINMRLLLKYFSNDYTDLLDM